MNNKPRILAIDPGTRQVGIAILEGSELIYYAVKTIRNRKSPQTILCEACDLILEFIRSYSPQVMAIEKMFVIQKSAALLFTVAEEMKSTAKVEGVPVVEYSPKTLRKVLCNSGSATKRDVANFVAAQYPELKRYLNKKYRWEELYYANIFDAIAVGLMALKNVSALPSAVEETYPKDTHVSL